MKPYYHTTGNEIRATLILADEPIDHSEYPQAHGIPIVGTAMRAIYTGTWAVYAGAWGLWGIAFEDVDWPLAVWGAAGFIAFTLQCIAGLVAARSRKESAPVVE